MPKEAKGMVLKVTSHRGHHEANVAEIDVAKQIFDKMTGKTEEALDHSIKTKIPDTFQELEGLWKTGKMGYMAFTGKGDESEMLTSFKEEVEDVVFIAPVRGG
jgi:hypothetical protein